MMYYVFKLKMAKLQCLQRPLCLPRRLFCISNVLLLRARYGNIQSVYQTTYAVENNKIGRKLSNSLHPFEEIPHDRRLPIVSSLMDVHGLVTGRKQKSVHFEHFETFKRHGGIAVTQIINNKQVVVSDPEICAEICRQEGEHPRRKEALEHIIAAMNESRQRHNMPASLIAREGENWRELRILFNKALMDLKIVKGYFESFDEIAQLVVKHLKDKVGKAGHIEDLTPILYHWAMESFSKFAFGKNIGLFSEIKNEKLETLFHMLGEYNRTGPTLSTTSIMKTLFPKKYGDFHRQTKQIIDFGMEIVKDDVKSILDGSQIEGGNQKLVDNSFLAYLLKKDQIPKEDAIIFALDSFRASLDTTSKTATWLIYLLGTHPEAQEKLYQEIQRKMSVDGKVDYNTMQRMPYLRACMKEQSRLKPTSIVAAKIFDKPISAGGYEIPEKTVILLSNYSMGRQEKLFADPHLFLPERWLREKDRDPNERVFEQAHPFASLPFGQGRRSCVGRRVAEAELQTLLAHLIRNFTFRYHGPEANGTMDLLLTMEHPLALTLQERV